MLNSVSMLMIMLFGLGGVAFVTLLERKLLSLSQIRLGPNKVILLGLLQPLSDGIKLLIKSTAMPMSSQSLLYSLLTLSLLMFFLILWSMVISWKLNFFAMSVLILIAILGVGTYLVMLSGWSPTSAFSKLGSLRSMLQGLSFEVTLVLVMFSVCLPYSSFILLKMGLKEEATLCWGCLWSFLMLVDTNRAPFDLLEGESELISGFNIEMSSLLFVFIFLSEYGMIMVAALLGSLGITQGLMMISIMFVILFLLVRSCYPRIRYDLVSGLIWNSLLVMTLLLFMMYMLFSKSLTWVN